MWNVRIIEPYYEGLSQVHMYTNSCVDVSQKLKNMLELVLFYIEQIVDQNSSHTIRCQNTTLSLHMLMY